MTYPRTHHHGLRSILVLIVLTAMVWISLGPTAAAARFLGGERVVVGPDEVVKEDLYITAGEVVIEGEVRGDVIVLAQKVWIKGLVTGDVMVMAQVLDISGRVMDDVRVGAQAVRVAGGGVEGDVLAAGFSVEVGENTPVGGDVVCGAYQALIAGDVSGNVLAGVNGLEIRGHVGGNVTADVGEGGGPSPALFMPSPGIPLPSVAAGLTLADGARVDGDVTYTTMKPAIIAANARVGGRVTRQEPAPTVREPREEERVGSRAWVLHHLRRLISLLLVGLVLFFTLPTLTRRMGEEIRSRPLPALGWGVVGFIGFLAALLIILVAAFLAAFIFSLITLGALARWAIVLGMLSDVVLLALFVFYSSLVGPVVVSFAPLERLDTGRRWMWLLPLTAGVALYTVVTAVPYLGGLVRLVVLLMALGVLILLWRPERPEPAPVPVPPPPPSMVPGEREWEEGRPEEG